MRGCGTVRSGSDTTGFAHQEHVDVQGPGAETLRPLPTRPLLEAAGDLQDPPGSELGVELHHHVQEGPLPGGPPTGSVSYSRETATTPGRPSTARRR